jgi:hypothetical protein
MGFWCKNRIGELISNFELRTMAPYIFAPESLLLQQNP